MNVDILNRRVTQLENCYGCCSTEGRVCLNETDFNPLDVNNPTTEEVYAWTEDNLTEEQRNNGTVLSYFIGDYIPYQNNLSFFFPFGAENSSITHFAINNNEIITTPILIKVDGNYVYDGSFELIVENWLSSNGFQGEVIIDIINQNIIIQKIKGGDIEAIYDYYEDGDSYEDTSTSLELPLVTGDGGNCDNPDFTWTLSNEGKITLDYKRTFNTKTVYVDAGSGSDVTGKRGYRNFPFKTLDAAISECQSGDTLYIFPGNYKNTIAASVPFNIYCEDGVNWRVDASRIFLDSITNADIKCRFDYLYSNVDNRLTIRGYILNSLDFKANKIEKIAVAGGKNNTTIEVGTAIDSRLTVVSNTAGGISSSIRVKNYIQTYAKSSVDFGQYIEHLDGLANIYVELDNYVGNVDSPRDGGIFNCGGGSDIGIKNLTWKLNDARFYPTSMYTTPPNPWYTATLIGNNNFYNYSWWEGLSSTGNQVFWVRNGAVNGTMLNYELKNYRGTGHGFMMYGWDFMIPTTSPTQQRVVNVKLQGYWEKGIPVSSHWFGGLGLANCPQNTIVNIELDVVCETSMGVSFWCTGGIHESNRFNISGKIVTKSPGLPCITISGISESAGGNIQTNNTITLKDLLLINDGTVPPIMVNPLYTPQVQEVNIINVKSNSLVVDSNVAEIGEAIVRNANYK